MLIKFLFAIFDLLNDENCTYRSRIRLSGLSDFDDVLPKVLHRNSKGSFKSAGCLIESE